MNDKTGWIDVIGGFIENGVEGIRSGYGDGISQATGDLIDSGVED